jgi:hypothetical protein
VVAPEDKRLCAVAQDIADLDKDAQDTITRLLTAVNAAMSDEDADDAFEEGLGLIRREMKRLAPLATDTYDRLEKVVPRPLKQDVVLVKTVSLKLFDILSNLKKLEDFNDIQTKLERAGAAKAAKATLRIDAVTRKRCGISISG